MGAPEKMEADEYLQSLGNPSRVPGFAVCFGARNGPDRNGTAGSIVRGDSPPGKSLGRWLRSVILVVEVGHEAGRVGSLPCI